MQSKKQQFRDKLEKVYSVCFQFFNEHGEAYVVYRDRNVTSNSELFITGDELDWDEGLVWLQGRQVYKNGQVDFALNIEETITALLYLRGYLLTSTNGKQSR